MMCRRFRIGLATVLSFSVTCHMSARADALPMTAYVQETAALRCGPSPEFYKTQVLEIGTKVEIYKTTADGWCGLRPLANSYSLIPAEAVESTDSPEVVRLNREGVRTRPGSLLTSDAHVKYVTLHKDESVKRLGRTDDGKWIKIAPPSGEFRWIHKQFLGSKKPPTVANSNLENRVREPQPQVALATFDSAPLTDQPTGSGAVHRPKQVPADSHSAPKSINPDLVADAKPIGGQMQTIPMVADETDRHERVDSAPPRLVNAWQARDSQQPATRAVAPVSAIASVEASPPITSPVAPPSATSPNSKNLNYEIGRINVALSGIVMQETSKWDLTDVRRRAERVVDSAQSSVDRQSGRELLKRIAEFESLQRRYDKMSGRSNSSDAQTNFPDRMSAFHRALAQRGSPVGTANTRSSQRRASGGDLELAAFLDSNNRAAGGRVKQASHSQPKLPKPTKRSVDTSHTGWLMPVITSNSKMPKYAITDSDGKILCFVSPGSGVKLKPYLRQRVTLIGESGFNSHLNKRHLIATRVTTDR